jgi:hypothetical protein
MASRRTIEGADTVSKRDPRSRLDGAKSPKRGATKPKRRGSGRPFAKGNPGGPGRPKKCVEEAYLDIGTEAVPPDKLREILGTLADKAGKGDVRAAQVIIKFLYGDDPVLTRKLMAELAEEIVRVRRGELANRGQPAPGGGPQADGAGEPLAGPATGRPEPDPEPGRDDAGRLASDPATLPLFPPPDAV